MKIRNGFVSNSSTGSFIVRIKDWLGKERLVSEEKESLLLGYGFKSIANEFHPTKKKSGDGAILHYYVVCNEDDVIEWLVKNRIPFYASTHYDQNVAFYDGSGTKVIFVPNFGETAKMHGLDMLLTTNSKAKQAIEEVDYPEKGGMSHEDS